jgi:hypothetical protein
MTTRKKGGDDEDEIKDFKGGFYESHSLKIY